MKFAIAALTVAICGFAQSAQAQQQFQGAGPTGQWQCQMSFSELNQRGQRTSGFTQEFTMNVQQNGQFYAQGMMNAVPYPTQFQSQGQWQVQGGMFGAQGTSTGPMGQSPWAVVGQLQGNMIQANYQSPSQYNRGGTARSIVMCQKAR